MPILHDLQASASGLKHAVAGLIQEGHLGEAEDYLKLLRQLEATISSTILRIRTSSLTKDEMDIISASVSALDSSGVYCSNSSCSFVNAVKAVMTRTGCSLKEAMNLCNDFRTSLKASR